MQSGQNLNFAVCNLASHIMCRGKLALKILISFGDLPILSVTSHRIPNSRNLLDKLQKASVHCSQVRVVRSHGFCTLPLQQKTQLFGWDVEWAQTTSRCNGRNEGYSCSRKSWNNRWYFNFPHRSYWLSERWNLPQRILLWSSSFSLGDQIRILRDRRHQSGEMQTVVLNNSCSVTDKFLVFLQRFHVKIHLVYIYTFTQVSFHVSLLTGSAKQPVTDLIVLYPGEKNEPVSRNRLCHTCVSKKQFGARTCFCGLALLVLNRYRLSVRLRIVVFFYVFIFCKCCRFSDRKYSARVWKLAKFAVKFQTYFLKFQPFKFHKPFHPDIVDVVQLVSCWHATLRNFPHWLWHHWQWRVSLKLVIHWFLVTGTEGHVSTVWKLLLLEADWEHRTGILWSHKFQVLVCLDAMFSGSSSSCLVLAESRFLRKKIHTYTLYISNSFEVGHCSPEREFVVAHKKVSNNSQKRKNYSVVRKKFFPQLKDR